ncbi:hypothetical protein Godav_022809 [Gossypium davidsonii]|uniref:Uncharacterized protein n=1 Tax=Gossypium davidsonii TaxID=34287 RepID=A0A7J8SQC5_GOSDV|nr:hypothetical protein [Gossypium davidsonii]
MTKYGRLWRSVNLKQQSVPCQTS